MGEFPSGQRGQTVNLLAMPSVVRIHLPPPRRRGLHIVRDDFFSKSHLSLIASLLLSKCDPLCWARIWCLDTEREVLHRYCSHLTRRRELHIVRDDFFSKVISHSFRRSSSPNATRCAGLALVVSRVRLIPLHQHSREAGTAFTPYRRAYRPSLPEKQ